MITEGVHFALPPGITREELLAKYRQTAPAWASNDDLVQKLYCFDAEKSLGGGVYIWKSRDAARRWHGDEYKARIRALYDCEVRMDFYDTLVIVDNVGHEIRLPTESGPASST